MTDRRTARAVGWLFLLATGAGLVGLALQQPVMDDPDYLGLAAGSDAQVATGVVLQLVMMIAVVAIAVVIYPVLRRYGERLALGYVVARLAEGVVYLFGAVWLMTIVTLSGMFLASGASDASPLHDMAAMVLAERDWAGHGVLDAAVFSVSAIILNAALLRARLVPAWLSGWGLLGAGAYLTAGVLVLYGLAPLSTLQVVLEAPLGLQEIVLALWLIVKGFTVAAEPRTPAAPVMAASAG